MKQKVYGREWKAWGTQIATELLSSKPWTAASQKWVCKGRILSGLSQPNSRNRLIESESMPSHCRHLPCRMTSSGCLDTVGNPSLWLWKDPIALKLQRVGKQQVWFSHVNVIQYFLLVCCCFEDRRTISNVIPDPKYIVLFMLNFSIFRDLSPVLLYILYLIQTMTLVSSLLWIFISSLIHFYFT